MKHWPSSRQRWVPRQGPRGMTMRGRYDTVSWYYFPPAGRRKNEKPQRKARDSLLTPDAPSFALAFDFSCVLRHFMKRDTREDGLVDTGAKEMFYRLAHSLGHLGGNRPCPTLRADQGCDIFDVAIKVFSFEVERRFALTHQAMALRARFFHIAIS